MSDNKFDLLVEKNTTELIQEYKALEKGMRRTRIFPVISIIAFLVTAIFFPNTEKSTFLLIILSPVIIDMIYAYITINKKLDLTFRLIEKNNVALHCFDVGNKNSIQ